MSRASRLLITFPLFLILSLISVHQPTNTIHNNCLTFSLSLSLEWCRWRCLLTCAVTIEAFGFNFIALLLLHVLALACLVPLALRCIAGSSLLTLLICALFFLPTIGGIIGSLSVLVAVSSRLNESR